MATLLGSLLVSLRLDSAQFVNGSRKAQREVSTLQSKMKLAGAAISTAFVGFGAGVLIGGIQNAVSGAFELASSMQEAASRIGLTVEALQELRLAAQETGVSHEQLETAMARLNVQLGQLQAGGKKAETAFKTLGLAAEDLKGKSPQEALSIIADKLAAIEDPTMRAAAAQAIFGKSYAALIPLLEGGSKALEDYAKQSRAQGQVTTEDAKRLDELADSWENLKTRVGVNTAILIANLSKINDTIQSWVDAEKKWEDNLVAGVQRMATAVVSWVNRMVSGISSAITGTLAAIWNGAKAQIDAIADKFRWLYDVVIGHSYVPDMVDGIAAEMGRLETVMVKPVTSATTKAERAFAEMAGNIRSLLDRLFPQTADALAYRAERELLANIKDQAARERALRALANERDEARRESGGDLPSMQGVGGPIAEVDLPELQAGLERLGQTLNGAKNKFGEFADVARSAFQELSYQISGVLLGFQSIGDAIRSITARFAQMALDVAFKSLGASFGIPGYAGGTSFAPGGLALVGERGPELVNLPRGSQVVPNHDLRGMGGMTINVNMQASGNPRADRESAYQVSSVLRSRLNPARGM